MRGGLAAAPFSFSGGSRSGELLTKFSFEKRLTSPWTLNYFGDRCGIRVRIGFK
jgi:hypothetical protein